MKKDIPVIHGLLQDDINYERLLKQESTRDAHEKVTCKYNKKMQKVKTKKISYKRSIG